MPRKIREYSANSQFHITDRGVNKCVIFKEECDFSFFLKLCDESSQKYNFKIYCYCLMNNHYHLYIHTHEANLPEIMHYINFKYASYFNNKHGRTGTLFQDRYFSSLVDSNEYAMELHRYIHLNPIEANLVTKAEDWHWSSYAAYLGKAKPRDFLDTNYLLSFFNEENSSSKQKFAEHTYEGLEKGWDPIEYNKTRTLLGIKNLVNQYAFSEVSLKGLLIYAANKHTLLSRSDIAKRVNLSEQSISKSISRLIKKSKSNDKLRKAIEEIDSSCPHICPDPGWGHYFSSSNSRKRIN